VAREPPATDAAVLTADRLFPRPQRNSVQNKASGAVAKMLFETRLAEGEAWRVHFRSEASRSFA